MNPDLPWCQRLSWEELDSDFIQDCILRARAEDLHGSGLAITPAQTGDISAGLLNPGTTGEAVFNAREPLVSCGLKLIESIIRAYQADVEWTPHARDGQKLLPGDSLGTIRGKTVDILQLERVALNFLQLLSGVSTETARYVELLEGSTTRLLDTRKTIPGYRVLQKYAVACGGGWNHRIGLFDRVMLKDNHLAATATREGMQQMIRNARQRYPNVIIEVEVDHLEQIESVIEAGAHVLMLDNFDNEELAKAIHRIQGRVLTEASGGITLERIPSIKNIGLDFISTGATVHKSTWKDIGLDWKCP
jgi:nicotinate-nucleotide pyrophosphorylase (carboxylating)